MKLSVVIVNYNVKFFLEQCLHSVQKAAGKIQAEIIVIDNHSVDGSCRMVREKFPELSSLKTRATQGFLMPAIRASGIRQANMCSS